MPLREQVGGSLVATKNVVQGSVQLIHGVYQVLRMPFPRVTIFGGSRLNLDSQYAERAHLLAHKLAQRNISVLTGGGPGIMEAVSCGVAHEAKDRIMGIGVSHLPHERGINACVGKQLLVDYFWVRKWLLIDYSVGFIVFPGGFGTVDELMELITLMQTGKLARAPIILVETDFWQPLLAWVDESEKAGFLSMQERNWLTSTNDFDLIITTINDHCQKCKI